MELSSGGLSGLWTGIWSERKGRAGLVCRQKQKRTQTRRESTVSALFSSRCSFALLILTSMGGPNFSLLPFWLKIERAGSCYLLLEECALAQAQESRRSCVGGKVVSIWRHGMKEPGDLRQALHLSRLQFLPQ